MIIDVDAHLLNVGSGPLSDGEFAPNLEELDRRGSVLYLQSGFRSSLAGSS
jgi:hypothetical protein